MQIEISKSNWQHYWGSMPLPQGAEALGVVTTPNTGKGALIRLANGNYVQGAAGGIRCSLNKKEIETALNQAHGRK